jgi:TonB family protein
MAKRQPSDPRDRLRVIALSVGIHLALLGLALILPARLFSIPDKPDLVDVVFYKPDALPPPPVPREIPKPEPPAADPLPQPAEIIEPEPPAVEPPQAEPAAPRRVEPRVAEPIPQPAPQKPVVPRPAPPRPQIRTNVFAQDDPGLARPKSAPRETRTAGFALAENVASRPTARVRTQTKIGNFEIAAAPDPTSEPRERVVTGADFGNHDDLAPSRTTAAPDTRTVSDTSFNETTSEAPVERRQAPRATIRSTSFAEDAPARPTRSSGAATGSVKQGQFGDGFVIAKAPSSRQRPTANPDTPVEIVSKPRPVYTEEARGRRVEGEVVLEVIFNATGQLQVLRVLGSLGFGLDESAVEAAEKIQFKPARRDGRAIDHAALLYIVFQLA